MYQDKVQQFIDSISREAIIDKEIELEEERTQKEEERRQKEETITKLVLKMVKYRESDEEIIKETGLTQAEIDEIKKNVV